MGIRIMFRAQRQQKIAIVNQCIDEIGLGLHHCKIVLRSALQDEARTQLRQIRNRRNI